MVRIVKKRPAISLVIAALVIAIVTVAIGPWAQAKHKHRGVEVLTVDLTHGIPVTAPNNNIDIDDDGNGAGPFYINGAILDAPGGNQIGVFHCWGWINTPAIATRTGSAAGPFISQEYDLDGRGVIQMQGAENRDFLTITGGTGEFANIRGRAGRKVLDPGKLVQIILPNRRG